MSVQPQLEEAKGFMRALWQAGDYEAFVRTFHTSAADDLAASLRLESGARALDIACGTGASTIPLARRGFDVTGLDLSPHLLEAARRKAAEQDLRITFDEGFLEQLPYADASFEVVVSMFGIMFSPLPQMAAAEIARVLTPGGQLALTNWTQGGLSGRMNDVLTPYLPPPAPDAPSMYAWGDAHQVRQWLEPSFRDIVTRVVPLRWTVDAAPPEAARLFMETAGPIQFLLTLLTEAQTSALTADWQRFWSDNDQSSDPRKTVIENEFLSVSATRK